MSVAIMPHPLVNRAVRDSVRGLHGVIIAVSTSNGSLHCRMHDPKLGSWDSRAKGDPDTTIFHYFEDDAALWLIPPLDLAVIELAQLLAAGKMPDALIIGTDLFEDIRGAIHRDQVDGDDLPTQLELSEDGEVIKLMGLECELSPMLVQGFMPVFFDGESHAETH